MTVARILRTALILAAFSLAPIAASAATLGATASKASISTGDIVTVRLVANSAGVAINQGSATLQFPADLLDVLSVTKSGSIFSLWVEEPSYSNTTGRLTFDGGVPTPGFNGSSGTVLTVSFHAKRAGTATLSLSDASLRANDGFGTNVLSGTSGTQITISNAVVVPAAPATPATPAPATATPSSGSAKGLIVGLLSPTHPDQGAWYQTPNPKLTWGLKSGVTAIETVVDQDPDAAPVVAYKPPILEKQLDVLSDGIWYFSLRAKGTDGWGGVETYRLGIDATAPEINEHTVVYDAGELTVSLSATDATSGIARYEFAIDDEEAEALLLNAAGDAHISTGSLKAGKHQITLRAFDKAGNYAETVATFARPESVLDAAIGEFAGITFTLAGLLLLMALISLLSLLVAAYSVYRLLRGHVGTDARTAEDIHRSFNLYKRDLEKNLRLLEKQAGKRDLTAEEAKLHKRMLANLADLERYIEQRVDS